MKAIMIGLCIAIPFGIVCIFAIEATLPQVVIAVVFSYTAGWMGGKLLEPEKPKRSYPKPEGWTKDND